MKKAILSTGLALALIATAGAASTTAKPSTHQIYVDGVKANVAAYEINDNNYFKLRDVAAILSGTDAQFEVEWDETTSTITLTSGKAYTTVGGELGAIPAGNQTAEDSTARIWRDGKAAHYTGYNINDNNFYKLRDIAEDFDFNVTWDGTNQRVDIITTESYVPEDETETPTTPEEPEQPEEEIPPRYNSEFEEAYDTLDYDEVNPDYQAQVDAFPGTPVTVSVELEFYDILNNRYIYPADYELWVVANRANQSNDFDNSFPETTAVKKIKTDSTGHATVTFDIPQTVYEKMRDNKAGFYSIHSPTDQYFAYDGEMYSFGSGLSYYQCEAGSIRLIATKR